MNKIIFISDFFIDEIIGGAEFSNHALIEEYLCKDFLITKIKSKDVTRELIVSNKNNKFIIANFFQLSDDCKKEFINYKNYFIIEHDHKYVSNNNPAIFENFLAPQNLIQNINFYKNAIYVFCQSTLHSEIIYKNTLLNNIVNLKGNIWTSEQFSILEANIGKKKYIDFGIIETFNKNKGMNDSIQYCKNKNINYSLIPQTDFYDFIENLSSVKTLVFMPTWVETFSRLTIEARILGCKLITNKLIGSASDGYLSYSGFELLNIIKNRQKEIFCLFKKAINNEKLDTFFVSLPKISIITSLFKAEKYIKNYLDSIVKQTIFNDCELILINANSPQNEEEIIKPYLEKFTNIRYIKLEKDPGLYGCWNMGIEISKGEYVCNSNVDDIRNLENLEIFRKYLFFSKDVDLVYGDVCAVTEIPDLNKNYPLNLFEHCIPTFSKENMIKCLPGPLPMWKKTFHDKYGLFDINYKYAGDWEMWLRAVRNGANFVKVNTISGFYYVNPNGLSTSNDFSIERFKEEKTIFWEYIDVFGQKVTEQYSPYFSR